MKHTSLMCVLKFGGGVGHFYSLTGYSWYLHQLSMWLMIPHFWQLLLLLISVEEPPGLSQAVCPRVPKVTLTPRCPSTCSLAWG